MSSRIKTKSAVCETPEQTDGWRKTQTHILTHQRPFPNKNLEMRKKMARRLGLQTNSHLQTVNAMPDCNHVGGGLWIKTEPEPGYSGAAVWQMLWPHSWARLSYVTYMSTRKEQWICINPHLKIVPNKCTICSRFCKVGKKLKWRADEGEKTFLKKWTYVSIIGATWAANHRLDTETNQHMVGFGLLLWDLLTIIKNTLYNQPYPLNVIGGRFSGIIPHKAATIAHPPWLTGLAAGCQMWPYASVSERLQLDRCQISVHKGGREWCLSAGPQ